MKTRKNDDLLRAFEAEGAKAKKEGKAKSTCPYSMSNAVTAVEVKAHVAARGAWMEGYSK